jgi:hypothetical protein
MQPGSDRLLSYLYAKSDRPHIIPIHPRAIAFTLYLSVPERSPTHTLPIRPLPFLDVFSTEGYTEKFLIM